MKSSYDPETDALFVRLSDAKIDASEEVAADVIMDFDAEGHIVGFEILNAKARLGERFLPEAVMRPHELDGAVPRPRPERTVPHVLPMMRR